MKTNTTTTPNAATVTEVAEVVKAKTITLDLFTPDGRKAHLEYVAKTGDKAAMNSARQRCEIARSRALLAILADAMGTKGSQPLGIAWKAIKTAAIAATKSNRPKKGSVQLLPHDFAVAAVATAAKEAAATARMVEFIANELAECSINDKIRTAGGTGDKPLLAVDLVSDMIGIDGGPAINARRLTDAAEFGERLQEVPAPAPPDAK